MTVKQLIKELEKMPQNLKVVTTTEAVYSSWTTDTIEVRITGVVDLESRVILEWSER